MKIIILAAGKGTRALPLTRNTPKPLLDLGEGVTLLERQIENIRKSGVIDEIVLVIGHLAEQIEAKLKTYKENGLKITTVYNPFYDTSNNLISLWLAKPHMNSDFIITNGDNIFEPDVFQGLVKNDEGVTLTTSIKNVYTDDDMKVILKSGIITRVSKEIPEGDATCESVGLVLVKGERHHIIFQDVLESLARKNEYLNKFWLEVFNVMANMGIAVKPFEIDGKTKWKEVDFHLDLEEARKLLKLD